MPAAHLLEDRDRPHARCRLEHRHDFGVKNGDQRIGSSSAACAAAAGFFSVNLDFMYSLIW
jgi:hypothetical protein